MTKSKSKAEMKPIFKLNDFIQKIEALIPTLDVRPIEEYALSKDLSEDMKVEMKRRHADGHFKNLSNCLMKGDKKKAIYHMTKIKKNIAPVSNDYPFEVGQKVWVNRYEHGWEPGWVAKISNVYTRNGGTHYYDALVVEDRDGDVREPFSIQIDHTRDAYSY